MTSFDRSDVVAILDLRSELRTNGFAPFVVSLSNQEARQHPDFGIATWFGSYPAQATLIAGVAQVVARHTERRATETGLFRGVKALIQLLQKTLDVWGQGRRRGLVSPLLAVVPLLQALEEGGNPGSVVHDVL